MEMSVAAMTMGGARVEQLARAAAAAHGVDVLDAQAAPKSVKTMKIYLAHCAIQSVSRGTNPTDAACADLAI